MRLFFSFEVVHSLLILCLIEGPDRYVFGDWFLSLSGNCAGVGKSDSSTGFPGICKSCWNHSFNLLILIYSFPFWMPEKVSTPNFYLSWNFLNESLFLISHISKIFIEIFGFYVSKMFCFLVWFVYIVRELLSYFVLVKLRHLLFR